MEAIAAYTFLGLTVSLAIARPRVGPLHLNHAHAGILGAVLVVCFGLVPFDQFLSALQLLSQPVVTIVSLMAITLIAEQAGVFNGLIRYITRVANGDARKLFALLFICGLITGTLFTNDAAILIFTPLVFTMVEKVKEPGWTRINKIPFYFGVLYVANMTGALVIANPINIVVAQIIDIGFTEYAVWMFAPALVSMLVSYFGLRWYFRKDIPLTYAVPAQSPQNAQPNPHARLCTAVLLITLLGFFLQDISGVPTWGVAVIGALLLSSTHVFYGNKAMKPIIKGIGWDVIAFLVGIFIVVLAVRNAGMAQHFSAALTGLAGDNVVSLIFTSGFAAAISSALIDNHPTADMMAWIIQDLPLPHLQQKIVAMAALIGGDLGPKMSPIGSLAALMWLRLLRERGVNIPYRLFLKINVPLALAAVLLSVATLALQYLIFIP